MGAGDLLVHVNVWTPKELNKEQREFFERMKGMRILCQNQRNQTNRFLKK